MIKLIVDGQEILDLWRYVVRFDGHKPTLYENGKRVTRAWSLEMSASQPADTEGANANTA